MVYGRRQETVDGNGDISLTCIPVVEKSSLYLKLRSRFSGIPYGPQTWGAKLISNRASIVGTGPVNTTRVLDFMDIFRNINVA